jgi:hypothetical protein
MSDRYLVGKGFWEKRKKPQKKSPEKKKEKKKDKKQKKEKKDKKKKKKEKETILEKAKGVITDWADAVKGSETVETDVKPPAPKNVP